MSVESFSAIRPQVEKIIRNYIETTFGQRPNYDVKLAQKWSNEAAEEIIKHVQDEKGQEFKLELSRVMERSERLLAETTHITPPAPLSDSGRLFWR